MTFEDYEQKNNVYIDNKVYVKTFIQMFLGLLATGLVSSFTYIKIGDNINYIFSVLFPIMTIVELVVVLLFSLLFKKLPPTVVNIMYYIYAVVNGVCLSTIFFSFEISSIVVVFFVSAIAYLIFALIGMYTKIDLSKIGNICYLALFACIVVSVIGLFLNIGILNLIIDLVVLILFFAITAYDMQMAKNIALSNQLAQDKIHVYLAMQLYLDFINIFLRILSLFGKRK